MKRVSLVLTVLVCFLILTSFTSESMPIYVDSTTMRTAYSSRCVFSAAPHSYTLQELSNNSSQIVCADLLDIAPAPSSETNVAHLRVCTVLKGSLTEGAEINVLDTGYEIGEVECTSFGEPLMKKGNRVILFLKENIETVAADTTPVFSIVGGATGKWFNHTNNVYYPSIHFSDIFPDGFVPQITDSFPKTLDEMKAAIL